MLLTNRFLFVHLPKTGGTFVSRILFELRDLLDTVRLRNVDKHAPCAQIPAAYRDLPIVSSFRHPLDLYVSIYNFGWWRRSEKLDSYLQLFRHDYPSYPNLSFEEFLRLYHQALCFTPADKDFDDPDGFGWATERFIRFYGRSPRQSLLKLDDMFVRSGRYQDELFDLDFLHTGSLNDDLYAYLLACGLPEDRLSSILKRDRIYPEGSTRDASDHWRSYYTPALAKHLRRRERLLFQRFPRLDRGTLSRIPAKSGSIPAKSGSI